MPFPFLGIRKRIRDTFFRTWNEAFRSDDGKAAAVEPLKGLLNGYPRFLAKVADAPPPYADLGRPVAVGRTCLRDDIIFITARFRSGSTLLWNLFRHVPGCTSYYEPLNERQWFNPQTRGQAVDATHREVDEYWREYEGLTELGEWYREEWIQRHLLMDENFHDPDMKRYIEILIERAPGRPVLQFNRVDFRLGWLRHNFPNAKLIHLYRHPRDQWISSLHGQSDCGRDAKFGDFLQFDKFYLTFWVRDLRFHFPFLDDLDDEHPYLPFYLLWKLSWMSGKALSLRSISFERLVERPAEKLPSLFETLDIHTDAEPLLPLIHKQPLGKWAKYADDAWFKTIETKAETILADFFS